MSLPTNCLAAIYHLPTTGGSKQPYPGSADVSVSAMLLPMDRHAHALEGGDLLDPFELYVPSGTDLRVGDKVVIDSTNYFVKKIFRGSAAKIVPHIRASLSTEP